MTSEVRLCECGCGAATKPETRTNRKAGKIAGAPRRFIRGHATYRHGESPYGRRPTPEYAAWYQMRSRCSNPKHRSWKNYGGRGITICERWSVYENFIADMGRRPSEGHSLDRKDVNGPYSPDNCRWATASEQALNRRPRGAIRRGVRLESIEVSA